MTVEGAGGGKVGRKGGWWRDIEGWKDDWREEGWVGGEWRMSDFGGEWMGTCIRESVDSLCRDGADAQYMQYLRKSRIISPQIR